MSLLISFLLEPAAYFLFAASIFYHSRVDRRTKIKVLYLYYFVSTILMVRAALLGMNGRANIEIYSLLGLLTAIGFGVYFYHTLTNTWKTRFVVFFCLLEAVYYIGYHILSQREMVFDSTGQVVLSIGVIIMSFLFMHQILTHVTDEPLSMNFDFWFVCSQMIYHLGAFATFLTFNYLTKKILPQETYSVENRMLLTNLWRVHNVLLFLTALINALGVLWITSRRKLPLSS